MTLNDPTPGFNVTLLFDAEYLRNGTRYSFNGILIETYYSTDSFRMTLSDSKIFSDMKRRAVSLRQLSFLYNIDFDRMVMQTSVKF